MLDNFIFALDAVGPLVLIMALGYVCMSCRILSPQFFQGCDKFVFKFLLPATLFCNIYSIESFHHIKWDIVVYIVACIFLIFLLGVLICSFLVKNRVSRGVAVQCIFRSNTALVGLPLATALGGSEAAAIMSVALGLGVPVLNVLCVIVLTVYTGKDRLRPKALLKRIISNPPIVGCLCGLAALALRAIIPQGGDGIPLFSLRSHMNFLYQTVSTLGSMASPLALVAIGGQLNFSSVRRGNLREILVGSLGRMVLAPVIAVSLGYFLDTAGILSLGPADYAVLLPFFGSPVAVSSAIMASEMGSDADLARQYALWTTAMLVVTLPVLIMAMRLLALI